ncbi:MAG: hypothetical protein H6774_04440 [Pseudomonadales bacterium]|nr:hypothetical protein [Pseudomonadales bacterium]
MWRYIKIGVVFLVIFCVGIGGAYVSFSQIIPNKNYGKNQIAGDKIVKDQEPTNQNGQYIARGKLISFIPELIIVSINNQKYFLNVTSKTKFFISHVDHSDGLSGDLIENKDISMRDFENKILNTQPLFVSIVYKENDTNDVNQKEAIFINAAYDK